MYTIQLFNYLGQPVYSSLINVTDGNMIYPLQLNKKPSAGCYQLEIINNNGVRLLHKIIVE